MSQLAHFCILSQTVPIAVMKEDECTAGYQRPSGAYSSARRILKLPDVQYHLHGDARSNVPDVQVNCAPMLVPRLMGGDPFATPSQHKRLTRRAASENGRSYHYYGYSAVAAYVIISAYGNLWV